MIAIIDGNSTRREMLKKREHRMRSCMDSDQTEAADFNVDASSYVQSTAHISNSMFQLKNFCGEPDIKLTSAPRPTRDSNR
jgi:hypothetical protein